MPNARVANAKDPTAAERKARQRDNARKAGLGIYRLYVHPDDWERVEAYVERVKRQREKAGAK